MDTPATLSLGIHCLSCNAAFRTRVKNPAPRSSWRQHTVETADGKMVTGYLCDQCSARFSSEDAILDYLAATIEEKLRQEATASS